MSLNAEQQAAVDYDGNLLMIAGPGAGKTKTLIAKAQRILASNPTGHIALVTFTDASTKVMRDRLQRAVSPNDFRRCSIQTFHKHCMNQLRASGKLGQLLNPKQANGLASRAINAAGVMLSLDEAMAELEGHKLSLTFTGTETPLVEAYEQIRRRQRVMDLWDVVRDAVVGMQKDEVQPLQATHILGDEYQDADSLQQQWMFEHASRGAITTVVGDDDQSIYGWRRALGYQGMMDFRATVNAATVVFGVNYRSHSEILLCADAVIRNNKQRVNKVIHPARGAGGAVSVHPYRDALQEAEAIAEMIKADCIPLGNDRYAPPKGAWGVIARTNVAFLVLTSVLRAEGIVYTRSGKDKMSDVPRLYCEFLAGLYPRNVITIEQVLHAAKVSEQSIGHLARSSEGALQSLYEGVVPDAESLEAEDRETVTQLARLCRSWRTIARSGDVTAVLEAVEMWFADHVAQGDNDKEALSYTRVLMQRLSGTLQTRASVLLRDEASNDDTGVQLHTMHSSKGLEFKKVALICCNAGVIPSSKAENVDEERRLFYVGITRAEDRLFVSYQANKGRSSFIAELEQGLSAIDAEQTAALV